MNSDDVGEFDFDDPSEEPRPWETEFMASVTKRLPRLLGPGQFLDRENHGSDFQADLIYSHQDGRYSIIEVKATLPGTRERLQAVSAQLVAFADALGSQVGGLDIPPDLILVVNGVLSADNRRYVERSGRFRVIDEHDLQNLDSPAGRRDANAEALSRMLQSTQPGRAHYARYQRLVQDILEYLLCPPLNRSIYESSNLSGYNRRDMIFPNYVESGFWNYMRQTYSAHYVVVDAKNYSSHVKKPDVLQIANYLSKHGTGLFGIIATRFADDPGSAHARREQWLVHEKLMIVLNDEDLIQMLAIKTGGDDPAMLIRQKVEDFRISF